MAAGRGTAAAGSTFPQPSSPARLSPPGAHGPHTVGEPGRPGWSRFSPGAGITLRRTEDPLVDTSGIADVDGEELDPTPARSGSSGASSRSNQQGRARHGPLRSRDQAEPTANATSGLYLLLRHVRPARLWIRRTVPVILAGADAADVPYAFYEVGEDLTTLPDALAAVEAEDMVLASTTSASSIPSLETCASLTAVLHPRGRHPGTADIGHRNGRGWRALQPAQIPRRTGRGRVDREGRDRHRPGRAEAADEPLVARPVRGCGRAAGVRTSGQGDREWFRLSQRRQPHIRWDLR